MKEGKAVSDMIVEGFGDGWNSSRAIQSMGFNRIRKRGAVVLADDYGPGEALKKAVTMTQEEVIKEVLDSKLKGRG